MGNKDFINQAKSGQKVVPAKLQRIRHQSSRDDRPSADAEPLADQNVLGRVGRGQIVQRSSAPLTIAVEAYAGSRADQTPRRFTMGVHAVEVVTVTDQWQTPDHAYFKIAGDDDRTYVIRYDAAADHWELTERSP